MSSNHPNRNKIIELLKEVGQKESRASVMFREAIAQTEGMSISDMECLDYVMDNENVTAGDLAKITGLTTGAVTSMIDRLEKAGFVKRERDTKDRRKIFVKPVYERMAEVGKLYETYVHDAMKMIQKYTDKELMLIIDWKKDMTTIYEKETLKIKKLIRQGEIK